MTNSIHTWHYRYKISDEDKSNLRAKYPNAITLRAYLDQHKAIPVGLKITNHSNIPPWEITEEMLKKNFPNYSFIDAAYVVEPVSPEEFVEGKRTVTIVNNVEEKA